MGVLIDARIRPWLVEALDSGDFTENRASHRVILRPVLKSSGAMVPVGPGIEAQGGPGRDSGDSEGGRPLRTVVLSGPRSRSSVAKPPDSGRRARSKFISEGG